MLDIKWIRENEIAFKEAMQKRGMDVDFNRIIHLDNERKQLTTIVQQLQQARNNKSKKLGSLKVKEGYEFERLRKDVSDINEKMADINEKISKNQELAQILDNLPNIPDSEVPYGTDESMNKLTKTHKDPLKLDFAKEHFDIGANLGMMDFEDTAKISGSRFVTLKGGLAKLERALINFMLNTHIEEHGFYEISPPILVKPKSMYNVGQLPKFTDDSYLTSDEKYRLIPTGEVPLTNMVADKILQREELPIRYTSYTECFRSEAGSAGKDTRGMIRNHQFGKVEMVTITTPEESKHEHEHMLTAAENILKLLDLPYRVMLLCSGDMGFSAQKTYDLEVWLPGQKKYREISSVSNCGDFQARRMKARYKDILNNKNIFVHTLNGSGLAVGRTLLAILENYQNEDGSVSVPNVLQSYMGGVDKIKV